MPQEHADEGGARHPDSQRAVVDLPQVRHRSPRGLVSRAGAVGARSTVQKRAPSIGPGTHAAGAPAITGAPEAKGRAEAPGGEAGLLEGEGPGGTDWLAKAARP
jgi:hypothetical protein